MPPVILAIVGALEAIGLSAAWSTFLAPFLLSIGASVVIGQISKLFIKGPTASSLISQSASRTIVSRS